MSCDQGRANALNEAFAAKFAQPHVHSLPHASSYPIDNICRIHVSEAAVGAALAMVSPNKACGTDNISARIIIGCADDWSPL